MRTASDDVAKERIVHAALNYATMIFSLTNTSIYASLTASIMDEEHRDTKFRERRDRFRDLCVITTMINKQISNSEVISGAMHGQNDKLTSLSLSF